MSIDKQLQRELEFYLKQSEDWKKQNHGKFVLIKDQAIHGIFESYEDALQEAVKKFDNEKFLIQQVGTEDRVNYNTFALLGAI